MQAPDAASPLGVSPPVLTWAPSNCRDRIPQSEVRPNVRGAGPRGSGIVAPRGGCPPPVTPEGGYRYVGVPPSASEDNDSQWPTIYGLHHCRPVGTHRPDFSAGEPACLRRPPQDKQSASMLFTVGIKSDVRTGRTRPPAGRWRRPDRPVERFPLHRSDPGQAGGRSAARRRGMRPPDCRASAGRCRVQSLRI